MKARWILRDPSPAGKIIGQAIVATWWPGRYYFCHTIRLDTSSALAKLTFSIEKKINFHDVPLEVTGYVTCVYRCNKDGVVNEGDSARPLYEKNYDDEVQAKVGHQEEL